MNNFVMNEKRYRELMKIDRSNAVNLLTFLLFEADNKGMLSVSIRKISTELNIGLWVVRGLLRKMYSAQILTHQTTHQSNVISICNIDEYKQNFCDCNTSNHTPNHTPKKSLEERKKDFAEKLTPYLEKYGKDTLNNFYQYWTQVNDGGAKMLFERQKAFQIPNRLATWRKNNYGSSGNLPSGMNLQNSKETDYGKGLERFNG